MGDTIYRIIPEIGKEVRRELWIQKWTHTPTNTLMKKYLHKRKTPILVYNSISNSFHLKIYQNIYVNDSLHCSNINKYYPNLYALVLINGEWRFTTLCKLCLDYNQIVFKT